MPWLLPKMRLTPSIGALQEDDVPLTKRVKTVQAAAKPKTKSKPAKPTTKRKKESGDDKPSKKSKTEEKKAEKKWETLHHSGVLFPPDYAPHGVKMLYDGKPVDLTPEQEEVRPSSNRLDASRPGK